MTDQNSEFAKRSRELIGRSAMVVPVDRVRQMQRDQNRVSQTTERRREAAETPGTTNGEPSCTGPLWGPAVPIRNADSEVAGP